MAIDIQIYNSGNNTTKNISVDFDCQLLAASGIGVSSQQKYFFKIVNGNQDEDGVGYQIAIMQDLSDLALNGTKQAAHDYSNAYANIKEMIFDYVYDHVNGHVADRHSSNVSAKAPMRFSN